MFLSSLHVFPLKSAGGLSLPSVILDRLGPQHDRRWMLIDEEGAFISQRTYPKLALVKVVLQGSSLQLHAAGLSPLSLPLSLAEGVRESVVVWGTRFAAIRGPAEADRWFQSYLSTDCRLVFMPTHFNRPVEPGFAPPDTKVAFADGYPLLLISQASLDELNGRLDSRIHMDRFRPNLVVGGGAPYQEDSWRRIRIGDVTLRIVKPCGRCSMTTVDQKTGDFDGKEPLKTLASYRRWNGEAVFGQNVVHEKQGFLQVGQEIEVLEWGEPLVGKE